MYSTELQLIDQFGDAEIAAITDEGDLVTGPMLRTSITGGSMGGYTSEEQAATAVCVAKIVTEQDMAAGVIDGYLAVKYVTPITDPPPVLTAYALDIVRYRLYDDAAPEQVKERYANAIAWLRDIAQGKADIGVPTETIVTGPIERTHDEEDRLFTMATLEDF